MEVQQQERQSLAFTTVFTDPERFALAGFLAGYRGLTRKTYALNMLQFTRGTKPAPWPCSPSAAATSSTSPAVCE
jgi:hypothetical protein